MEVVELDAQSLAALQVVEEAVVGLLCACFVRMCEIDQIAAMRDNVLRLVVRMRGAIGVERGACVVC